MALGFGNIGSLLWKWVISPLFWVFIIIVFFGIIILLLRLRKKKRLHYKVVEIVDLGQGKTNLNTYMRAGYYGKRSFLRGLWWKGEEVLKTNYGEQIYYASSEDFQEIDGERGIICFRDPIRRNVLVPINKLVVENKELLAAIAPADYTDVGVDIFNDSIRETTDRTEKIMQFAAWAILVGFSLVSIILIIQMVKNGQTEAADLILQAGKDGAEACRRIANDVLSTIQSNPNSAPGGAP